MLIFSSQGMKSTQKELICRSKIRRFLRPEKEEIERVGSGSCLISHSDNGQAYLPLSPDYTKNFLIPTLKKQ